MQSSMKEPLSNEKIIDNLSREVEDVIEYALNNGLNSEEIESCLRSAFTNRRNSSHSSLSNSIRKLSEENLFDELYENHNLANNSDFVISEIHRPQGQGSVIFSAMKTSIKIILVLLIGFCILLCLVSHKPTRKLASRHLQVYVYPVMRHLRLLTLPFLSKYPFFTEIHEVECLVRNPYFIEPPVDCWSCEEVRTIVDLTGHVNLTSAYLDCGVPFITQVTNETRIEKVTFTALKNVYGNHTIALERGTSKIFSDDGAISCLNHLFSLNAVSADSHVTWKVNRVSAVQVIRKIFQRPYFVPTAVEVALQRFIFIDGAAFSSYRLPITEFANVWVAQGSGYRQVILIPTRSCKERCHTIAILLKPGDILYYNWQFHRAKTAATKISDEASVTLVGSFY